MRKSLMVIALSAASLVGVLALHDLKGPSGAMQAQRPATQAQLRAQLIAEAQRAVRARLRDPSSAVFGPAFVGESNLVCGLVNTRNGVGGMTGMAPYIAGYAGGAVAFYQSSPDVFDQIWAKTCGGTTSKTATR
jgi:type II secretory pathway pseudopilin PulG